MSLFSQLLREVSDEQNHTLSSCLLKAKLLASKLKGRKFRQWVDVELDGYQNREVVPDYRIIRPRLIGHFSGGWGSRMRNVLLTTDGLPPEIRELVENYWFTDNIGSLEALLDADTDVFRRRWDINLVDLLRRVPGVRVDMMVLQDAESLFTKTTIRGVLHAIRNRLLDFLIELSEQYPDLEKTEEAIGLLPLGVADRIAEQVIYHNCTITGVQAVSKQQMNVGGNVTVGGDLVVAAHIKDSFNKVIHSAAPSEIKDMMKQLADALAELVKALPADKAKEVSQDYEILASETAKQTPRASVLKSIGNGIIETAKVAGKVAEPAIAIIGAILKHYGA
jgi:hypothetical protein